MVRHWMLLALLVIGTLAAVGSAGAAAPVWTTAQGSAHTGTPVVQRPEAAPTANRGMRRELLNAQADEWTLTPGDNLAGGAEPDMLWVRTEVASPEQTRMAAAAAPCSEPGGCSAFLRPPSRASPHRV